MGRRAGGQVQTGWWAGRQTGGQAGRQANRQTGGQAGKQAASMIAMHAWGFIADTNSSSRRPAVLILIN